MSKKFAKIYALLLVLMLILTALAGCGSTTEVKPAETKSNASATTSATETKQEELKKVELIWYTVGGPHGDTPKVVDEWNKMLAKDLNCTVKLNFTTWNDWQTKYNLLLTSGEKVDMIFASTWAGFYKYAKQGAFKDITELLPKYAPKTWETVPKQDWSDVTLQGKIYAVPSTFPEYTPNGWVYREDWRKKLNLPEIKDIASLEAYMDGVKKNMSGVIPINGSAWNEISTLFAAQYDYQTIGGDSGVVVAKSYKTPRDIIIYPFTPEYVEWCKKTKSWADKGYWSKNTLSSKQEAGDLIKAGKGAIYWRNPAGAGGFINDIKAKVPDAEIGYLPFTRFYGYAVPNLSINNGMAITKSSANPERSLMVLDKLRNDPAHFDLMTYGIKGNHYDMADDGKHIIVPAKGQDPKVNNGYDIASWGWRYEPLMLNREGGWTGFDELVKEFKGMNAPNIFSPIYLDYEPVKAEFAAVNQVMDQYGKPLMMGLVPDVDAAIKTYQEKLKAAGVDKLAEYIKQQATIYFDEKGIK